MPPAMIANINLKRLYQFQIFAELGSASKACAFLGISNPALTQSIGRLEDELNTVLFDRSTRPLRLTISGEHLLAYARKIQLDTAGLYEQLQLEQGGQSGIIRLGCGTRWMVEIIPRVVGRFIKAYPDIRLSIQVAQMDELVKLLDDQQISLMFGTTDSVRRFSHHQVTPVGADHFTVVARLSHPLHKRKNLSLADLAGERWIIGGPATTSTIILRQALRDAGLSNIVPAVELSDTLSVANMLRNGDFVSIFTHSTVRNLAEIGELPIGFQLPQSNSGAICLADRVLSVQEKALVEYVAAEFS